MSWTKSSGRFISIRLALFFIAGFQWNSFTFATNQNQNLQQSFTLRRDHDVYIWFDDNLPRNYPRRQIFLQNTIKQVAGTFGTIAIDNAPILDKLYPIDAYRTGRSDRVLIPSIVAHHNRESSTEKRVKVIVSFDLSPSSGLQNYPGYLNSFVVAKHYADVANTIFPGTVDTLLIHHDDYLRVNSNTRLGHVDLPKELQLARNSLGNTRSSNSTNYKLGVTISLNLCEIGINSKTSNSLEILSKFVEYTDIVIPVVYVKPPAPPVNFTPCLEHEMQMTSFQSCEGILQNLKPEVEVIPLVICNGPQARQLDGESQFFQCWQLMSDWAKKRERKVIMFEAFDSSDPEYVQEAGWWRLQQDVTSFKNEYWYEKKSTKSGITCSMVQSQNVNQTLAFKPTNDASRNKTYDVMRGFHKTNDLSPQKPQENIDDKPEHTENFNFITSTETLKHNSDHTENVKVIESIPSTESLIHVSDHTENVSNESQTSTETSQKTSMTLNKEANPNKSGSGGNHIFITVFTVLTCVLISGLAVWFSYKRKNNWSSEVQHQRFRNGEDDFQVLL